MVKRGLLRRYRPGGPMTRTRRARAGLSSRCQSTITSSPGRRPSQLPGPPRTFVFLPRTKERRSPWRLSTVIPPFDTPFTFPVKSRWSAPAGAAARPRARAAPRGAAKRPAARRNRARMKDSTAETPINSRGASGAGGRIRTDTGLSARGILSPLRIPVSPLRRGGRVYHSPCSGWGTNPPGPPPAAPTPRSHPPGVFALTAPERADSFRPRVGL